MFKHSLFYISVRNKTQFHQKIRQAVITYSKRAWMHMMEKFDARPSSQELKLNKKDLRSVGEIT